MTQREHESLPPDPLADRYPSSVAFDDELFGNEVLGDELLGDQPLGDELFGDAGVDGASAARSGAQPSADRLRSEHARRRRHRRRGWLSVLVAAIIVAVVGTFVTRFVINHFKVADYSGAGTGSVRLTIASGATANDIGALLQKDGVVKSTEAFTDAAANNVKSQSIQPGTYRLRRHMSGKAALTALLDPSTRDTAANLLVPEGATSSDVATRLTKAFGAAQGPAIQQALRSVADLDVPVNYKSGGRFPTTAEGFLYPATYTSDPGDTPRDALIKMVARFTKQDRGTGFATDAASLHLTPYQALIIASIAQSEAKYAADMPKVVRTILNRIAAGRPLQFDSTSSYACKLKHATPCVYAQVVSPYNTYLNKGLPPTPIDNPGAAAMAAAVRPAAGNWLFFVNNDKPGHLFFTHDDVAFERARKKCVKNNWGCG